MEKRVVKQKGRKEAFLGALIGTVANIAGSAISAKKKKKADALTFAQDQAEQQRMEGLQQAQVMTGMLANQDYVGQYQNKVTLMNGGKVKVKKGKTGDRVVEARKYKMGGRKKAEAGTSVNTGGDKESSFGSEATAALSGVAGLAGALFTKPKAEKRIKKADGFTYGDPKTTLAANSYSLNGQGEPMTNINSPVVQPTIDPLLGLEPSMIENPLLRPRIQLAKYGTKKVNKFK